METILNAAGIFGVLILILLAIAAIIMPLVILAISSKLTAILKILKQYRK